MDSSFLLRSIYQGKPALDLEFSVLSAPIRHMFMIGTMWHLSKDKSVSSPQILEVGSWLGASSLSWAQGIGNFFDSKGAITCVDAWEPFFNKDENIGKIYDFMDGALETETAYQIYRYNMSTLPKTINYKHFRAKSADALPLLRKNCFDVVFIDGDHSYQAVKEDVTLSLDLVKEGGIICGDDLNLQYDECDVAFLEENKHIDFTKDPKTGRNVHPGVTVAIHEIFGKVTCWGGFWAMQKQNQKWVKIDYSQMPEIYPAHFTDNHVESARSHFADIEESLRNA